MKEIKRKYKNKIIITTLDLIPLCDHYCEICLTKEELTGHHIYEKARGGTDDLDNLMCLCKTCHWKIHHLEGEDPTIEIYKQLLRGRILEKNIIKEREKLAQQKKEEQK